MSYYKGLSLFTFLLFFSSLCLHPIQSQLINRTCESLLASPYPIAIRPECPAGYYCPNIVQNDFSTYPQVCPPTVECQILRLSGKFCEAQGIYEPIVCPTGYYCETFRDIKICPEGYYCPLGSTAPTKCQTFSWCPEGSMRSIFYGGVIILVIIDSVCFVIYKLLRKLDKQALAAEPVDEEKQRLIVANVQDLAAGFERGCLGKRLDLQFEDLNYRLPTGKVILSGVTGHIQPGRVTAVMGPSGAGKTTFLNVLMGKVKRSGGSLFINGKEDEMSKFKKVIGYVPQEDIMLRELTVRENILYSARIRLPKWTDKEVEHHVDAVINTLGVDHVQYNQIGDELIRGISGGQRKRVNIGLELAACPIALFLDEPTSGLDSTAALSVCSTLKNISSLGMTVVAVIHQPRFEIFDSFDDILLLAPGGRTVYIGPQKRVLPYFESLGFEFPSKLNPADVLMDVVAGRVLPRSGRAIDLVSIWHNQTDNFLTDDLRKGSINAYLDAEENGTTKKGPTLRERIHTFIQDDAITSDSLETIAKSRGANFFRQIYLSHNRSLMQQYRKVFSYALEIFVGTLAGLLIGTATLEVETALYQGVLKLGYILISPAPVEIVLPQLGLVVGMAVCIAGAPAGVLTFGEEKVVYWREAACGHNKLAYYIGKTLSTLFRFTMSSLHFAALLYLLCRPLIGFFDLYLIILLTFFGVYGLAAVVSMVVPRENAPLLAVISGLIFSTLCGYGPTLKMAEEYYVKWLFGFSYNRWASEALYDKETEFWRDLFQVENISAPFWGYTLDRFGFDLGMMVILGVGLRIVAFFLLITVNKIKQQ